MNFKIKKDKYLNERGGSAKIIDVKCVKCGRLVLLYQKDGLGWLKRCYFNRIIEPEKYMIMHKEDKSKSLVKLDNLICICGEVIGSPFRYKDGRLSFLLRRGSFKRNVSKN